VNRAESVALLRKAAKILYDTAGPLGMDFEDQMLHAKFVSTATLVESGNLLRDTGAVLVAAQHVIDVAEGNR
jgi:hypothetical protein